MLALKNNSIQKFKKVIICAYQIDNKLRLSFQQLVTYTNTSTYITKKASP